MKFEMQKIKSITDVFLFALSLYYKFCVFAQLYFMLPKPLQGISDNRWRGHRCTVSKCPPAP